MEEMAPPMYKLLQPQLVANKNRPRRFAVTTLLLGVVALSVRNVSSATMNRKDHLTQEIHFLKDERKCNLDDIESSGWLTTTYDVRGCNEIQSGKKKIDLEVLSMSIKGSSSIRRIDLSDAQFEIASFHTLCNSLSSVSSLTEFILQRNGLGPNAGKDLAVLIKSHKNLKLLNLDGNSLGPSGVSSILAVLEDSKMLQELSLRNEGQDAESAYDNKIARTFSGFLHGESSLKVLRVGNTGIQIEGVNMIMTALEENPNIVEFEIAFDNIGPLGGELIAEAIKGNNVLEKLCIDGSGISDDGAAEIAHALQSSRTLKHLSVESNNLSNEGAMHFANVLEANAMGLTTLNLGYKGHGIDGEWWHHINALLRCNQKHKDLAPNQECKASVINSEKKRVCSVLNSANLGHECKNFIDGGVRRVGDLLNMGVSTCATLGLDTLGETMCRDGTILQAAQLIQRSLGEL